MEVNNFTFVLIKSLKPFVFLQLEGGVSHLPLVDSSMRATPITPSEWRKKLEATNNINFSYRSNLNKDVVLLDVRNGTSIY